MNEAFVDLYAVPRMNETRLKNLLARFRIPERVFKAGQDDLLEVKGIDKELATAIASYRRSAETTRRLTAAKVLGVTTIGYGDDGYPENLKRLAHMPPVLFVRGEIRAEDVTAAAGHPKRDYNELIGEIGSYNEEILKRPRVVALNKVDLVTGRKPAIRLDAERAWVSGLTGQGIDELRELIDRVFPKTA